MKFVDATVTRIRSFWDKIFSRQIKSFISYGTTEAYSLPEVVTRTSEFHFIAPEFSILQIPRYATELITLSSQHAIVLYMASLKSDEF